MNLIYRMIPFLLIPFLLIGCAIQEAAPSDKKEKPADKKEESYVVIQLLDETGKPLPSAGVGIHPKHIPKGQAVLPIAYVADEEGKINVQLAPGEYEIGTNYKGKSVYKQINVTKDTKSIVIQLTDQ